MVNKAGREFSSKKKSKSSFNYKPRDERSVKDRAERTGGRFDSLYKGGFDIWRPKVGDNLIRILPPTWDDHEHYGYDIWVHSYVGADNSSYLCLAKMKGEHCPLCAAQKEAKAAGEEDEAKALAPKNLVVCWILDRDEDNADPVLYGMSWTMDRDIAALCHNKRTGKILLIDHPDDGYDITIKRQGQGLKTKYFGMAVDRDSTPILDDADDQEKVLEFVQENPIPSILNYYDEDYLEKVLAGTTAASSKDDDLDDDEDDKKSKKRGRKDEDEDDEDEKPKRSRSRDDDDEEDEKPRRSRSRDDDEEEEEKPKRKSRDKDEEDDEDEKPRRSRSSRDDDDEEDEKPKKSRRRDDDEEDSEEEEARSDKKRSRSSRDDDEEDDEDEKPKRSRSRDDDEEEEDEKPKRTERVRTEPRRSRGR